MDRIWPRGIAKQAAQLNDWNRNVAPSTILRKWFDHKEERFLEFEVKYREELKQQTAELDKIRQITTIQKVTLLYGAKNSTMNQAVVLREVLVNEF
ncbi:DUF488 domain-containing protein [Flavobacterium antarcticum]